MKREIIVHVNPDLDVCACVALTGVAPQDVHFLPAGIKEIPEICPCCGKKFSGKEEILDHPLGHKGEVEENGEVHAAAASLPEAINADLDLLAEVDEQDRTGKIDDPKFSLASVLAAIRSEASERGIRGTDLDREVVTVMSRVLKGLNLLHEKKQVAHNVIANARIEEVADQRFALLAPGGTSPQVGIVLNEEYDVSGAIFIDGNNIGVTRYPGRNMPDLRKLQSHLPGWFIHSAGFLACWGSRKSPATTPPPAGTPQTQDELLVLMRKVFE